MRSGLHAQSESKLPGTVPSEDTPGAWYQLTQLPIAPNPLSHFERYNIAPAQEASVIVSLHHFFALLALSRRVPEYRDTDFQILAGNSNANFGPPHGDDRIHSSTDAQGPHGNQQENR